jgi:hypothetical protein
MAIRHIIVFSLATLGAAAPLFAQAAQGKAPAAASRSAAGSTEAFDPHAIAGYWTRNPQEFLGRNSPPCPDCREPIGGYGFGLNVPPMTPEGQKRFDANKTGKGFAPDSAQALANPQIHIGRRRGVPPGLANDPQATCNPDGIPRLLLMTPAPYEIVVNQDRVFQFFEWTWAHREVWTDGRILPEKIDYVPRWFGYSVGRWDGNTFVVTSTGFDERSWVDSFGYPHSDQMKLEERYRLRDRDTLELQITLTDPVIYTRPWVSEVKVNKRVPKEKMAAGGWGGLMEDICAPLDEVETFNKLIRDPAAGLGSPR